MVEVVSFTSEHLEHLLKTGLTDMKIKPFINPAHGPAIEKAGGVYTVLDDGNAVAIGGIFEHWKNRGETWLLFGKPQTKNFVVIFKMVERFLELCPFNRLEMIIDYDFEQGHRWARLLGFKLEAERLRKYRPDGSDVSLYVRLRD